MAGTSRFNIDDPLGVRNGVREAIEKAFAQVDAIINGEMMAVDSAPWGDSTFQRAIVHRLHEMKSLRAEANKLAIVKEVFGGK